MALLPRTLALAVVVAHFAVVVAPCAGIADPVTAHPEAATSHHEGTAGHHDAGPAESADRTDASAHDGGCGEHSRRTPPDATASCPCGCDDSPAPGTTASRVGFGLFAEVTEPLAATPARDFVAAPTHVPAAPPTRHDPVPI